MFQGKEEQLQYPPWAVVICISLVMVAIMPVPVVFLLRHYNVIKNNSSLSSVSYKKGRIIKESPPPGDGDDTSLIRAKTPGEAPSPGDIIYSKQGGGGGGGGPEADHVPNGHCTVGYLMVSMQDGPESDL